MLIFLEDLKTVILCVDPKRAYFRIFQQIKNLRNFNVCWRKHG